MKISYAITVCNEFLEIQRLVTFLLGHKRPQDEIEFHKECEKKTKLYHLLANGKIDKYSRELYYDKTMRNFNMFCSGEKPEINFIRII